MIRSKSRNRIMYDGGWASSGVAALVESVAEWLHFDSSRITRTPVGCLGVTDADAQVISPKNSSDSDDNKKTAPNLRSSYKANKTSVECSIADG